jgi:fructose-1,6-bisphosphatase/inositol monophosphatase family enzyme
VTTPRELLAPLRRVHEAIRQAVIDACASADAPLAGVERDGAGDTIYAIDRVSEDRLLDLLAREVAPVAPVVVIAEGLSGPVVLPPGTAEGAATFRVIVDPIDGTRGLMYQKRSAWILTGVAPNRGEATRLSDIALAVQTEIPLVKQHLSDTLWALRGEGAGAERWHRFSGERTPLTLRPSSAATIAHGFAQVSRFFPGARAELAAIDDEIVAAVLGPVTPGKAHCFEDQYICSAGQLYELMAGHDRFTADLRPLMEPLLRRRGQALGICCHPYDLCTALIARELGVVVTDAHGAPLDAPLDVEADVAWVGYANEALRAQIAPALAAALARRGLA